MEQRSARVLLADDEDAIRLTLEALLRRRGYIVTSASDGAAAMAALERHTFDLLLLDLKMPGLSGLDVARRARQLQPATLIMILTGSTSIGGVPEEPGLEDFEVLLKTASPREVLERVAAMIG